MATGTAERPARLTPTVMPTDGPRVKDRRHNRASGRRTLSDAFESMMRFGRNGLDEEQRSVIRTASPKVLACQTRATGTSVALADGGFGAESHG